MAGHDDHIDHLRVASPCPTNWEQMPGDDRVRFCKLCNLHVYNISKMTRKETAALIAKTEGRLCARLYRRSDGSVITKDCPIGLRAIRRRVATITGAVFATIVSLAAMVVGQSPAKDKSSNQQVTLTRRVSDSTNEHAVVEGSASDQSGAVVVGAKVTIVDLKGQQIRKAETNSEGRFRIAFLPAGSYHVVIQAPDFVTLEVKKLTLKTNETVFLKVMLRAEVFMGAVMIVETPLVDKSPSIKMTFPGDLIRRLPIP